MMQAIYNLLLYFFNPLPGPQFNFYVVILILILILVASSVYVKIHLKTHKEDKNLRRLFKHVPGKLVTFAAYFFVYIIARYANIYLFSMRTLLFATLTWLAYFLYQTYETYRVSYPELKHRHLEQMNASKYLKRKKKK